MKKAGAMLAGVAVLGTAAVVGTTVASGGGEPGPATSVAARKEPGAQSGKAGESARKNGQKCTDKRVARGKRQFVRTWTRWENQHPWTVSGWGPGTLDASDTFTIGHTVTVSLGATAESVNATLGYQGDLQWHKGFRYAPTLREKKHYQIDIGRAYKIYQFDVYEPTGRWMADLSGTGRSQCAGLHDVHVGKGKALMFWRYDHRLRVIPEEKR